MRNNPHQRRFTKGLIKHLVDALQRKLFSPYDGLTAPQYEHIDFFLPLQGALWCYDLCLGELIAGSEPPKHPLWQIFHGLHEWFIEQVKKRELSLADVQAQIEIAIGTHKLITKPSYEHTIRQYGAVKRDSAGTAYREELPSLQQHVPAQQVNTLQIHYRIVVQTAEHKTEWQHECELEFSAHSPPPYARFLNESSK